MNRPSRKHPNRRKLAELPYQQLHAKQWEKLEDTLTDFDFLMASVQPGLLSNLISDYHDSWKGLSENGHETLRVWTDFFQTATHILYRADDKSPVNLNRREVPIIPANHILLQLACEHAVDSPVTQAAETWLWKGGCDWLWLRNLNRPEKYTPNPCLMVLEGHRNRITEVFELEDDILLSGSEAIGQPSEAFPVRFWNLLDGHCIGALDFGDQIQLPDGKGASLSEQGQLSVYDHEAQTKQDFNLGSSAIRAQPRQTRHGERNCAPTTLNDGRIVSFSLRSGRLELLNPDTRECCGELRGHTNNVLGISRLKSGNVLTWAKDDTLRVWDANGKGWPPRGNGHGDDILGEIQLLDGRVLSWSIDGVFQIWDSKTGSSEVIFEGWSEPDGVFQIPDTRILVWRSNQMSLFDIEGQFLDSFSFEEAKEKHPGVWGAYSQHEKPELYFFEVTEDKARPARCTVRSQPGGINVGFKGSQASIVWQGEGGDTASPTGLNQLGGWMPRLIMPGGIVIASYFNNLVFLELLQGGRHISFTEAQEWLNNRSQDG